MTTPTRSASVNEPDGLAPEQEERQQRDDERQRRRDAAADRLHEAERRRSPRSARRRSAARFSRTRSNTTIVSWTEKPMTVSIAVTNSASIWRSMNVPRSAKTPDGDDDVVEQRDDRGHAHAQVAEPVRDPDHDREAREQDEQERLLDELVADDRPDGVLLAHLVDAPEALLERGRERPEAALGGHAGHGPGAATPAMARLGRVRPLARRTRQVAAGVGRGVARLRGRRRGVRARCHVGAAATAADAPGTLARRTLPPGLAATRRRGRGSGRLDASGAAALPRSRRLAAGRPAAGPLAAGPLGLDERQRLRPDEHVVAAVGAGDRDLGAGQALLLEDLADLGRRRGVALEVDLPDGPAGVGDREPQAEVRAGEEREQDEDEADHGDDAADHVGVAALPDEVKHERRPLPLRGRVPSPTSSSEIPKRCRLRAHGCRTIQRSMSRLSVIAVNIEMSTPMMSTSAKPFTTDVPK